MYGKKRIQNELISQYGIHVGQSRIQILINQAGLKRKKKLHKRIRRNRCHMYSVPSEISSQAGGFVYMYTKHIRPVGAKKYYVFVAIDHKTRISVAMASRHITAKAASRFLSVLEQRSVFRHIKFIGTDNGSEFLGVFDQILQAKGIQHVFTTHRSPKQNPFAERMIRTIIDEEFKYHGVQDTIGKQQEYLDRYLHWYNTERQHSALNYQSPLTVYKHMLKSNTT